MTADTGGPPDAGKPEKRSPTEPLDVQRKWEGTITGKHARDILYPYIQPDYEVPFLHIGTDKQLFPDNFRLDHLRGVERGFPIPDRPDAPIVCNAGVPWEPASHIFPVAAVHDPEDGKFKL